MNKQKSRQHQRHAGKYTAYKTRGTRMKNKIRKMMKVLKRQPNNHQLAKRAEVLV